MQAPRDGADHLARDGVEQQPAREHDERRRNRDAGGDCGVAGHVKERAADVDVSFASAGKQQERLQTISTLRERQRG